MQRIIRRAESYCRKLNKTVQKSLAYNEAMLYAKFGGSIGISKCSEIAQKYSA